MKARVLIYTLAIIGIFLIQSTLLEFLKVFNVKPNLLLIFIISIALLRGNFEGAVVGFFCGLLQDVYSGKVIGIYSLLGLFTGIFIGSVNKSLYRENFLVIIFFTAVTSFFYEFMIALISRIIISFDSFIGVLWKIIVPELIYNCIISMFMYIMVIKLVEKINGIKELKRKY